MKQFKEYLTNIKYPKGKDSWNIAGILKDHNAFYKFDTRPLKHNAKVGFFKTKANKMVFDIEDQ